MISLPLPPVRGAELLLLAHRNVAVLRTLWPATDGTDDHGRGPGEAANQGKEKSEFFSSLKQVGGQKGSNEGGTYVDKSGQKWYVKNYKDPAQAAGEHVSNQVYKAVGAKVPETVLGPNGKLASKWMDDAGHTLAEHGVTQDNANKILDHFAADVMVANWDTVGTGHDNILVSKSGEVTRVDQGGTLLHRAQGALKPESALHGISEWNKLSDRNVNPYYSKVFHVAGVKNADALGSRVVSQVAALDKARPAAGWKSFVEKHAPNAPKGYAEKAGKVLESRHTLLREKVASLKGLAGWDPALHPRDPDGKFGDGDGSTKAPAEKKQKAAPATKEQIAKAVALKKEGHSYAHIEKHTGLNPKQAATIVHKHNKAEAALKEKAVLPMAKPTVAPAAKPTATPTMTPEAWAKQTGITSGVGGQHTIAFNAVTAKYEVKDPSGVVIASKFSQIGANQIKEGLNAGLKYDPLSGGIAKSTYSYVPAEAGHFSQFGKVYDKTGQEIGKVDSTKPGGWVAHQAGSPLLGGKPAYGAKSSGTPTPTTVGGSHPFVTSTVTGQVYTWQEKTTANSPGANKENLGKWAYFDQNGKQVSAPHAKDDAIKAQATMHNGKGLDYKPPVASSYTGDQYHVSHDVGGALGLGTQKWPISDNVERKIGTSTHTELTQSGTKWANSLDKTEKNAVASYTGSSYSHINSELYKGGSITPGSSAAKIQSALNKAPSPPPPQLVWRGVSNQGAKQLVGKLAVGDKLKMDGFQSTSIKPEFANSWGGGHVVFEIKPSKGAYIQPISHHSNEYEYLLPHGASYRVHGITTVNLHGTKKSVVQLEMLQ